MADFLSFSKFSNRDLLHETMRLAAGERSSTARLVAALREVDSRRLYLDEGYSCMFFYCTHALHLSESAAYRRIEVARVSRAFPQVLEALTMGALNLTTAVIIAPHLTLSNADALIAAASFKKRKEVEGVIAEHHPKPDVPAVIRKQPAPRTSAPGGRPDMFAATHASSNDSAPEVTAASAAVSLPQATPAPTIAPLSPARFKIQFTADQDTHDKLRRAQALLRHQVPTGDIGTLINKALTLLIADVERKKLGIVKRPRASKGNLVAPHGIATAADDSNSRHIPASVKRAVVARDGGQCAFVGAQGRCDERGFLEFHHVVPYAAGGKAIVDNIALRCRAHNGHEAALYFGEDAMPRRARADSG